MKKLVYLFNLIALVSLKAQESKEITYIRQHALLAVQEMHLYKVPSSITLAQGLLETGAGKSKLANQANNHFGIKCKGLEEWALDKPRVYHDDDAKGECFRKYESAADSYRDHSKFLALRPYYKDLFLLELTDYKAWAQGLKKSGYATDGNYPSKLISIIERYKLDEFDKVSTDEVYAKLYNLYNNQEDYLVSNQKNNDLKSHNKKENTNLAKNVKPIEANNVVIDNTAKLEEKKNLKKINYQPRPENPYLRIKNHKNDIPYVVAQAGETITTIAKTYNKMPSEIAGFNEIQMGSKLKDGQIVFFGKKKTKGSDYSYKVQEGDDMYTISQRFGVKINSLYKLNNMEPGEQPRVGQRINLKTKAKG